MIQKKLLQMVFQRVIGADFQVTYWDGEIENYGGQSGEDNDFEITLNEKLNLNEIKQQPQLKIGEAYMRGDIDIKGDLKEIMKVFVQNLSNFKEELKKYKYNKFWKKQQEATLEEQEKGVQDHYDIGNDFFELWQDETMTYSCAYFKSREDELKEAQLQKIDHILKKLNLKPGEKLLDIGCGWGHLAMRAAKNYNVEVLGITLSEEQMEGARAKIVNNELQHKIEIRKQDFRDLAAEDIEFDKIVSVGMFEHVGREHIPEYFEAVDTMLKKGGLSLLHTITHLEEQPSNPWLEKYIFPWGYIPSLREIVWELPKHRFHLKDVEDIGFHYSLTAEHWYDNYEEVTEEVRNMFDEKFVRMWRLFLAGVVATFRYADTSVHQLLFSKGKNIELPLTREYMYNE
ncbi:MAG: cyclopropane-fatty-acyl-phospholipid synthase family protein [Halanaerobiales bacterium]